MERDCRYFYCMKMYRFSITFLLLLDNSWHTCTAVVVMQSTPPVCIIIASDYSCMQLLSPMAIVTCKILIKFDEISCHEWN